MPEIWDSSDEEYEHIVNSDCTDAAQDEVSFKPLIHFVVTFLLSWQAIFRVSNLAMDALFKFIGVLICKMAMIL